VPPIKPSDIASARALASEVTERGARLFEHLKRDGEIRDARNAALRFLDAVSGSLDSRAESEYLERSVREAIGVAKDETAALERQLAELAEDEKAVDSKMAKRRAELDRNQKRLESLQNVRCVGWWFSRRGRPLPSTPPLASPSPRFLRPPSLTTAGPPSWTSTSAWSASWPRSTRRT
jgi:hypothetical protein